MIRFNKSSICVVKPAYLMRMSMIERSIQVNYELRVYFTQSVFDPANVVLRNALHADKRRLPHKAMVILDEALAQSQPDLTRRIETYFETHSDCLALVCPPLVIARGRRTK